MISKLALGTVQLGLDYGVSNDSGKPSESIAVKILEFAEESGIQVFDTAHAYGDSERVIGNYLCSQHSKARIITKIPPSGSHELSKSFLHNTFNESKVRLRQDSVYGLMFHSFADYYENKALCDDFFAELKEGNQVIKTGVSVYNSDELASVLESDVIDLVQFPMNIFDLKVYSTGLLNTLESRNIEYYVRSVFLQGLFFLDYQAVVNTVPKALPFIKELDAFCEEHNIHKTKVAMPFISNLLTSHGKIVFGANNTQQIADNINLLKHSNVPIDFLDFVLELSTRIPIDVTNPSLWNKN